MATGWSIADFDENDPERVSNRASIDAELENARRRRSPWLSFDRLYPDDMGTPITISNLGEIIMFGSATDTSSSSTSSNSSPEESSDSANPLDTSTIGRDKRLSLFPGFSGDLIWGGTAEDIIRLGLDLGDISMFTIHPPNRGPPSGCNLTEPRAFQELESKRRFKQRIAKPIAFQKSQDRVHPKHQKRRNYNDIRKKGGKCCGTGGSNR